METLIVGRVVEQGTAVREASVVEGTWESGIRTFWDIGKKGTVKKR
jgi:hypothetical protein